MLFEDIFLMLEDYFNGQKLASLGSVLNIALNEYCMQSELQKQPHKCSNLPWPPSHIWAKMSRKNNGLIDVLNLLFLAAYCGQL